MNDELNPCNLCVIVRPSETVNYDESIIGLHVILIHTVTPMPTWFYKHGPYWKCTNSDVTFISHKMLRKIKPPPLEVETEEECEV